jgi:hypothetical protein
MFVLDECDKMLDETGKFKTVSNSSFFRHESSSSKDLHAMQSKQASDDVLSYSFAKD